MTVRHYYYRAVMNIKNVATKKFFIHIFFLDLAQTKKEDNILTKAKQKKNVERSQILECVLYWKFK